MARKATDSNDESLPSRLRAVQVRTRCAWGVSYGSPKANDETTLTKGPFETACASHRSEDSCDSTPDYRVPLCQRKTRAWRSFVQTWPIVARGLGDLARSPDTWAACPKSSCVPSGSHNPQADGRGAWSPAR